MEDEKEASKQINEALGMMVDVLPYDSKNVELAYDKELPKYLLYVYPYSPSNVREPNPHPSR